MHILMHRTCIASWILGIGQCGPAASFYRLEDYLCDKWIYCFRPVRGCDMADAILNAIYDMISMEFYGNPFRQCATVIFVVLFRRYFLLYKIGTEIPVIYANI